MGHAVNLAARLEGVNKQYGTYQLISENTHKYVKDDIITRKLDKVRVVNINTPIRLYELLDLVDEITPDKLELLNTFNTGLELFEKREWEKSGKYFAEVLKITPNDGPSKIYMERCLTYLKKAPPDSWDGVYNLAVK